VVYGDSSGDDIAGGFGNDYLDGGNQNDTIGGGGGDDIIIGGRGNDVMNGGRGDDTFVFEANSGDDRINLFKTGAGSDDVLDFSALGIQYSDLTIAQQGSDTLITTPLGDTVLLTGILTTDLDMTADFLF